MQSGKRRPQWQIAEMRPRHASIIVAHYHPDSQVTGLKEASLH